MRRPEQPESILAPVKVSSAPAPAVEQEEEPQQPAKKVVKRISVVGAQLPQQPVREYEDKKNGVIFEYCTVEETLAELRDDVKRILNLLSTK